MNRDVNAYKLLLSCNNSLESVSNNFNIDIDSLLDLLAKDNNLSFEVKIAILTYFKKFTINSNKVLVMADTHLGSNFADMKLIDAAFNYAAKKGITNVLHAGDFIQGKTDKLSIKYGVETQIDHIIYSLAKLSKFNIYYLFGNHEMYLSDTMLKEYKEELEKLKNVILLGHENSYIYLNDNYPVKINHYVPFKKMSYKEVPEIETVLSLEGHHHSFQERYEGVIGIPPCSTCGGTVYTDSGFIVLENCGDKYISDCKIFTPDYKVSTRKISEIKK